MPTTDPMLNYGVETVLHAGAAGRFEDDRGVIQDLFGGEPVTVTTITTVKGAVRGNHVHKLTDQWTLILSGRLLLATDDRLDRRGPGWLEYQPPKKPHAWKALEDTTVLVFTRGPRATDYASDTYSLKEPLL